MEAFFEFSILEKASFTEMKYTWDEAKRQSNLKKHGLDFTQAHKVFEGLALTFEDNRFDYGEERFVTIGLLDGIIVIVHTETVEEIRIISMRKANKHEQNLYYKNIYG